MAELTTTKMSSKGQVVICMLLSPCKSANLQGGPEGRVACHWVHPGSSWGGTGRE